MAPITRQVRAFQGLMVNSDGRRYDNRTTLYRTEPQR